MTEHSHVLVYRHEVRCARREVGDRISLLQLLIFGALVIAIAIAGCGSNEICDLLTGRCEPSGMCNADDQCTADERCDLTTGECVPAETCIFNSDCPPGQTCDMVTGTCVSTDP